jgi:hypothetical protein
LTKCDVCDEDVSGILTRAERYIVTFKGEFGEETKRVICWKHTELLEAIRKERGLNET